MSTYKFKLALDIIALLKFSYMMCHKPIMYQCFLNKNSNIEFFREYFINQGEMNITLQKSGDTLL